MKRVVIAFALTLVTSSAFAELSKDEVKRLNSAGVVINELRNSPEKGVPEQLWEKAECVVVIPAMKKAAFVFGGEYGSGVMSCRRPNGWSSPVFMQLAKGSWGLQVGAQETDLVLLVMNRQGLDKLLEDKVSLGADASVAAGPVGRAAAAATDAQMRAQILSYSQSHGVFAGIDLSGGVLRPDKNADENAYGPGLSAREVVTGTAKVASLAQAEPFLAALRNETRATTGH